MSRTRGLRLIALILLLIVQIVLVIQQHERKKVLDRLIHETERLAHER